MVSGGAADSTITLRYTTVGDFSVNFTMTNDITHCVSHATHMLTVNDTVKLQATELAQVICLGNAITAVPVEYSNATLSVNPALPAGLVLTSHHDGKDSIKGTPTAFQSATDYTITAASISGCASKAVTFRLTVNPTYAVPDARMVCTNELPYTWNGVVFTGAGTQATTLTTVNGCDSVVTMTLTVGDYARATINRDICQGESFSFGGKDLTVTGIYHDTIVRGGTLCDSITELRLTVKDTVTLNVANTIQDICLGTAMTR